MKKTVSCSSVGVGNDLLLKHGAYCNCHSFVDNYLFRTNANGKAAETDRFERLEL